MKHTLFHMLPFCHVRLKTEKPKVSRDIKNFDTLGGHIYKRRLELGLKQKEVAKIMGVAKATISKWETNINEPDFSYLPRIHDFLGYVQKSK